MFKIIEHALDGAQVLYTANLANTERQVYQKARRGTLIYKHIMLG